jgi:hypothetical protein
MILYGIQIEELESKAKPVKSRIVDMPGLFQKLEIFNSEEEIKLLSDQDMVFLKEILDDKKFKESMKIKRLQEKDTTFLYDFVGPPGYDIDDKFRKGLDLTKRLKKGYWKLWEKINQYEIIDKCEREIFLPIFNIHRPKVPECNSVLSLLSEVSSEHLLNIDILGIGGGASKSYYFSRNSEITVNDVCATYSIPIILSINVYKKKDNEQKIIRTDIIEVKDGHKIEKIRDEDDLCGKIESSIPIISKQPIRFSHLNVSGTCKETYNFKETEKYENKIAPKIELPIIGDITIEIKNTITVTKEIKYIYNLAGKHNYSAYSFSNTLGHCWDWDPK